MVNVVWGWRMQKGARAGDVEVEVAREMQGRIRVDGA